MDVAHRKDDPVVGGLVVLGQPGFTDGRMPAFLIISSPPGCRMPAEFLSAYYSSFRSVTGCTVATKKFHRWRSR